MGARPAGAASTGGGRGGHPAAAGSTEAARCCMVGPSSGPLLPAGAPAWLASCWRCSAVTERRARATAGVCATRSSRGSSPLRGWGWVWRGRRRWSRGRLGGGGGQAGRQAAAVLHGRWQGPHASQTCNKNARRMHLKGDGATKKPCWAGGLPPRGDVAGAPKRGECRAAAPAPPCGVGRPSGPSAISSPGPLPPSPPGRQYQPPSSSSSGFSRALERAQDSSRGR